jgi:hypothetical protein
MQILAWHAASMEYESSIINPLISLPTYQQLIDEISVRLPNHLTHIDIEHHLEPICTRAWTEIDQSHLCTIAKPGALGLAFEWHRAQLQSEDSTVPVYVGV